VAGRTDPQEETPEDGADERKPFLLRIPAPLMAELRGWAAQEVRSLNGQIEFLLREAVRARRKGSPKESSGR
jgi:hypothetical protein